MLYQQAGIPDNVAYLVLGIVILFTFLGSWVGSYIWRLRNLRRDIMLLAQMEQDDAAVYSEAEDASPSAQLS
jgi:hypothetical protein